MYIRKSGSEHSGFSVIELIVVVLIIGILAAGAGISISIYYNADAKRAAQNLNDALNTARTHAIAENNKELTSPANIAARVFLGSDNNYYVGIYTIDPGAVSITEADLRPDNSPENSARLARLISLKKLSNSRVDVYTAGRNSTDKKQIDNTRAVEYRFDKATGRCKAYELTRSGDSYQYSVAAPTDADFSAYFCEILLEGSESFRLVFTASGRCYAVD